MKKITRQFFAPAMLLFAFNSFAQFSPVWMAQYQHTVTPGFSNEGRRVAEDPTGNLFVLSDVTSDIDPNGVQGTSTHHYVVISKYSSTGAVLVKKTIDIHNHIVSGYNNMSAFGLEIDAAGNVFVGYTYWSSITGFDVVLEKYDNNLSRIWNNGYMTSGSDVGVDLKLHPNGTVYAVVKTTNVSTVYSLIESVSTSTLANLVYSFPLNLVVINSLALDGAQKAYLCGYSVKGGYKNVYVGAINLSTSLLLWSSMYTPSLLGDDVANKITVGTDGNIYTVGTSFQGALFGNQTLVLKNLPGNPRFSFTALLGEPVMNDQGLLIYAGESGWLYVGATSGYSSMVYRIPSTGILGSPSKLDFHVLPSAPFTSITGITMSAMKVSPTKNIYVTGQVDATGPLGAFSSSYFLKASVVFGNAIVSAGGMPVMGAFNDNRSGVDITLDFSKVDAYWLTNSWDNARNQEIVTLQDIDCPAPLREAGQQDLNDYSGLISLHPNPANSRVTVTAGELINTIELMDLTGNRVLLVPADVKQITIDISSLASGIYFCKTSTESGVKIKKLIVN